MMPLHRLSARIWRQFATGVGYVLYGLAAVVLCNVVFPLIVPWLPGPMAGKQRKVRWVIHHVFRLFIGWMRVLGLLSFDVQGRERLKQPGRLIVANHSSLIDVFFLIALSPDATCIVRASLWDNPFIRGAIRYSGYIRNADPERLIPASAAALQRGTSLILFPQGTRTLPAKTFKFKRGAARIALRNHTGMIPVFIHCKPTHLMKGMKWYNVPAVKPHYTITVGEEIQPGLIVGSSEPSVASRRLTRYLETYFAEQAHIHEQT